MGVEKNDAIKIRRGMQTRWAYLWAPASEEAKYLSVGNCPLFLLVPPDSVECGGPSFNWLRQTQSKPFLSQDFVK